jgi:hypothetical protein
LPGIVLAVAAVVAGFGLRNEPNESLPVAELAGMKNQPVGFSHFKGKVVFVNNWASWVSALHC